MGEVYAIVGEKIKSNYASIYEKTKRNVRMNFNDMDFENAKERDALEDIIKKMEQIWYYFLKCGVMAIKWSMM